MAKLDFDTKNPFKVKLVEQGSASNLVVLDVSPDIIESQTVHYKTYEPVHMPGAIYVFGNSASRTYSLSNVRLVCRSSDEATRNLYIINTLRGWTKPRFGVGSSTLSGANTNEKTQRGRRFAIDRQTDAAARQSKHNEYVQQQKEGKIRGSIYGAEQLGAPPSVLRFSAYSDPNIGTKNSIKGLIHRVPVVITQLSVPFVSESDYILTSQGEGSALWYIPAGIPVPAVMTIDISLAETHSPREFANFSLGAYRQGRLTGF